MRTPWSVVSLLVLGVLLTSSVIAFDLAPETINQTPTAAEPNLFQLLSNLNATSFADLINKTGLASTLTDATKNTTVFVPTNDAIKQATFLINASTEQLKQVLLYHLTHDLIFSNELTNGQLIPSLMTLPTLSNFAQELQISVASRANQTVIIKVNDARIVGTNFRASNGVAHLLSSVIVPPPLVSEAANTTAMLSTFVEVIEVAGMQNVVNGDNVTVFAPVNDGFGAALKGFLLLPNSSVLLQGVLSYHVVPNGVYYTSRIPQNKTVLPSGNPGNPLTVERHGENITVNGATVFDSDVLAANGVVHLISALLLPPGFAFNLDDALQGLNATVLLSQITRGGMIGWLVNATKGNASHTIFAPTNAAFQSTDAGIANYSVSQLLSLLRTHVVLGLVDTLKPGQELTNLNNDTLVVGKDGASIKLKGDDNTVVANITGKVNVADNGNVYSINHVIRSGNPDDDSIPELVVIIVLVTCVPALLFLLGIILLWDLRNWWKKRQVLGYSPISGDDYDQS